MRQNEYVFVYKYTKCNKNATKMHKNITFCYVKFAYVNYLLYFCAQF